MTTTDTRTPTTAGAAADVPVKRPKRRRSTAVGEPSGQPWVYVVLSGGLVLLVGPFIWMLLGSFRPDRELKEVPPSWLPQHPTLSNYTDLLSTGNFPQYFLNSAVVAIAVTVGNLLFCSMLGYAFAKLSFPGKRPLFAVVLATLMVPGVVTFVPLFVLVSNLGMANSFAGLIFPFLAGPFGVFLMRQFMMGLPDELIDAARVDGAGEWRIFTRVIMPLCKPALATLGILTFLTSWNNFLWPLVVAQSDDRYTLPVGLAIYAIGENKADYGLLMAGSVVIVAPILLVFIALQRFFVQGIAMTGIK
jgi:multiple sugar transport system permease protein